MKYLIVFLVSMVPIVELRGAMGFALSETFMNQDAIPFWVALPLCVIGNMLPVPIIYFFARRVLIWGADKRFIGPVFRFFLRKGEKAGQKLAKTAGRRGLFISLMLFVGIPIPGTGAWTGTLGASFLNMGFKSTVASVCLGVVLAGIIMALFYTGAFSFIRYLIRCLIGL